MRFTTARLRLRKGRADTAAAGSSIDSHSAIPAPVGQSQADNEQLGRLVRRGLTWSLGGLVVGRVGTLASGIILARLLDPQSYGVFAVALVAMVLIVSLNDLGLEQALVRWPGDIKGVAPTAKTVILLSSIAQFSLLYAIAPYFANAMNAPEATGIVRLLAVCVVVNGAFAVPSAVLTRSFQQDRRTTADFIAFLVTLAVTITLALVGVGPWSLAWGRLVGNSVNGMLHAAFAGQSYRFGFDRSVARPLMQQGLPIAGLSLVAVAVLNADSLVVGQVLGPVALGFYVLAFNLSSWPVSVFAVAVWRVSVPAFARLQDEPQRLADAFVRSFGLLMAVTFPVCGLLAVFSHPLIRFVYGAKWETAAGVLSLLACLGALRVAMQLMTDVLVAVGRSQRALLLQVMWLATLVPGLAIGAHWGGLRGVAAAHVIVAGLLIAPLHVAAIAHLGIRPFPLLRAIRRPVAGTAAAVVASLAVLEFMPGNDFLTLALGGITATVVYALVLLPWWKPFLDERLLRRRSEPPAPDPGAEGRDLQRSSDGSRAR